MSDRLARSPSRGSPTTPYRRRSRNEPTNTATCRASRRRSISAVRAEWRGLRLGLEEARWTSGKPELARTIADVYQVEEAPPR